MQPFADFSIENACGFNPVCGVDEVGRGPWAGPIVAGAAILPGLVAGDRIRRVIEAKAQRQGRAFAEAEADALALTGLRSYVTQRQIADQIVFLASERGRTISGQAVSVCADTQALL